MALSLGETSEAGSEVGSGASGELSEFARAARRAALAAEIMRRAGATHVMTIPTREPLRIVPVEPHRCVSAEFLNPEAPAVHHLTDHGGPKLGAPELRLILVGNPPIDIARLHRFARALMTGGYLEPLRPYGYEGGGAYPGDIAHMPLPDAPLDEPRAAALVRQTIASLSWPEPNGQRIYALVCDPSMSESLGNAVSCQQFWGYHSGDTSDGLLFVVLAGCTNLTSDLTGALCSVLAHEIAESVSDPFGSGWWEDATGFENADICQGQAHVSYAGENIQQYWTNESGCSAGAYNPVVTPTPQPQPQPPPASDCKAKALAIVDQLKSRLVAQEGFDPPHASYYQYGEAILQWARNFMVAQL